MFIKEIFNVLYLCCHIYSCQSGFLMRFSVYPLAPWFGTLQSEHIGSFRIQSKNTPVLLIVLPNASDIYRVMLRADPTVTECYRNDKVSTN